MIPYAKDKQEDEQSIVSSFDYEGDAKRVKCYDFLLLNRPLKVIVVILLLSILSPTLIYYFVFYGRTEAGPPDGFSFGSCVIPREARIPCGLGDVTVGECHRQCCYDRQNNVCYHRIPSRFSYLTLPRGTAWTEEQVMTPRFGTVPFDLRPSVPELRLSIDEVSSTHLTLTYYDHRNESHTGSRIDEKTYNYTVSTPELNVVVNVDGNPIFNTGRGPTIAADNIWEISFRLTQQSMYGLGEIPLRPGAVRVFYNHRANYSSIPLIYARMNESYHGMLLDTTAPTEISIREDNQIVVRSLARTSLKLHLFTGPEPKDIMRDVMKVTGEQMELEYWMLGAHICSEVSATDAEALTQLNTYITNANRAAMQYESHCGIRPLVFEDDVEPSPALQVNNGARAVRNARKKFVPHLSPYIRYEVPKEEELTTTAEPETFADGDGTTEAPETNQCTSLVCKSEDLMLRLPSEDDLTTLYVGTANDHTVVYPDYTKDVKDLLTKLWRYDVTLDGILLENNWPLDDSEKSHDEARLQLPYFSEALERAFNSTPRWNVLKPEGEYHFYDHNKYGGQFLDAIKGHFDQESLPAWSSSQWMRTDAVVNRQNVKTTWLSLRTELVAAALGGISGHRLWSTPICGDTENFDLEAQSNLCIKWYMAGTYLPMIKLHSKTVARDPLAFEGVHRNLILGALNERSRLMPYFYTVLKEGPLLRPMFYQYPFSENLVNSYTQFHVGDDLMIAPNLLPSQSHVHVRMPPGTWYEFGSGLRINSEEDEVMTMTTTEADFITLIRGGSIVPIQRNLQTTVEMTRRQTAFTLVVALTRANFTTTNEEEEELEEEMDHAKGHLRLHTNMTVTFTIKGNQLVFTSEGDDFTTFCGNQAVWMNWVSNADVYGLADELNNMDNHRTENINVDLCNLRDGSITHTLYS